MPHKRPKPWKLPPSFKTKPQKSKKKQKKQGQSRSEGQGTSSNVGKEDGKDLENFSLDKEEVVECCSGDECECAVAKEPEKTSELEGNAAKEKEFPLTPTTTKKIIDIDKGCDDQFSEHCSRAAVILDDKITAGGSTCDIPQFFDNFDKPAPNCSTPVFSKLHLKSKNENVEDGQSIQDTHGEGKKETLKSNYNNWDQSFVSVSTSCLQMQELEQVFTSDFFKFYADESVRKRIFEEMDLENYGPPLSHLGNTDSEIRISETVPSNSNSDVPGSRNSPENPFESNFDQLEEEWTTPKEVNSYPNPSFSRNARNAFEFDISDFDLVMANERASTSTKETVKSYPGFSGNANAGWHTFPSMSETFVVVPTGVTLDPGSTECGNIEGNTIEEFVPDVNQINEVERLCASRRVEAVDDHLAPTPSSLPEMSSSQYLAAIDSMDLAPDEMAIVRQMLDQLDDTESRPDSTGCLTSFGMLPEGKENEDKRTATVTDPTTPIPIFKIDERVSKYIWGDDHLFSLTGGLDKKDDKAALQSPSRRDDSVVNSDSSEIRNNSIGNMEREHPFTSTPLPISKQENASHSRVRQDQMCGIAVAVTPKFADVSAIEKEVVQTVGTLVEQVMTDLKPCEKYLEEQFQELGLSLTHIETPESQVRETAEVERNEAELLDRISSLESLDNGGVFLAQALDSGVAGIGHNENDLLTDLASTSVKKDPPIQSEVWHQKPVRWRNYDNLFDDDSLSGTNQPIGRLSAAGLNRANKNIAAMTPKCGKKETQSESAVNKIGRVPDPDPGDGDESISRAESIKQEKKKSGLLHRFTRFVGKRLGGKSSPEN